MFGKIIPREEKFFDHFKQAADILVEGAKEFEILLTNLPGAQAHAQKISEIEHRADKVTHHILELLHKTFITPLDREEIHELINRMDDIMDFIEAASERIYLYKVQSFPPQLQEMAKICVRSCEDIRFVISNLENLKDPSHVLKACVEINRLENEADHLLRSGMANLYENETDLRYLMKMKEILEILETVTDRCEDVANIVEGIVLEHS